MNDIISEEIGLHSDLGQDIFQQVSLFPAAGNSKKLVTSHSHKQYKILTINLSAALNPLVATDAGIATIRSRNILTVTQVLLFTRYNNIINMG